MELIPFSQQAAVSTNFETYEKAQSVKQNLVWKALDEILLEEVIQAWLGTLHRLTALNYKSGIKKLIEYGILNPFINMQTFSLINHESVLDQIKLIKGWAECTKQARAACYISLTAFLDRRLQGVVKKAKTNKEKGSKTFFRVYEKVKTNAMNQSQWQAFLNELEKINPRDCLIAKIILQGGKRVNEVLSLQIHQIDWVRHEITFIQSKTKGYFKETVITYPETVLNQLKSSINNRQGHAFVTRSGKPVDLRQVAITFAKAGVKANIPFKVTPHVLRASTVTYLKGQGFSDGDIMKVTGHASSELIYAYDKGSRADNASRKVSLVG